MVTVARHVEGVSCTSAFDAQLSAGLLGEARSVIYRMEHVSTVSRSSLVPFVRAQVVLGWCFSQTPLTPRLRDILAAPSVELRSYASSV